MNTLSLNRILTMRTLIKTSLLSISSLFMLACQPKPTETKDEVNPTVSDTITVNDTIIVEKETNYFPAIERFFVNEIGKQYVEADCCVPFQKVVAVDERDAENILVWGDFWVYNYNRSGDTLKAVAGGNHPGLLHIRQTDTGYEVIGFDQVADGSDNLKSAQQIFDDKYEAFHAIQSDDQTRERHRLEVLANYVEKHNLNISFVQDYGWPAKQILNE